MGPNINEIITKDLVVDIDVNNLNSWNQDENLFYVRSLKSWNMAYSDNLELLDFGLTAFDIGQTNEMHDRKQLSITNTHLELQRIGKNLVSNAQEGEYSGYTATTVFDDHPIIVETDVETDSKYFSLSGGYLTGFFKLEDYEYGVLPERYPRGITIENLLYIKPNSEGIFYYMGARAEDKYIPNYTGETRIFENVQEGVYTSTGEYLHGYNQKDAVMDAFRSYENRLTTKWEEGNNSDNVDGNIIAFGINKYGTLFYRYIDDNGRVVSSSSPMLISFTGSTLISIVYEPNEIYQTIEEVECLGRRKGKLRFYVNGRLNWIIEDFNEFYFWGFSNDKTKQIGVPYSISWGGGSFGLKNSWHYHEKEYELYVGQNADYICNNFKITGTIE